MIYFLFVLGISGHLLPSSRTNQKVSSGFQFKFLNGNEGHVLNPLDFNKAHFKRYLRFQVKSIQNIVQ